MGVISVRLDDETEQWIRDHGQKPGAFCRLAVMKEVRWQEIEEASAFLRKHAIQGGRPSEDMVREDRDVR